MNVKFVRSWARNAVVFLGQDLLGLLGLGVQWSKRIQKEQLARDHLKLFNTLFFNDLTVMSLEHYKHT